MASGDTDIMFSTSPDTTSMRRTLESNHRLDNGEDKHFFCITRGVYGMNGQENYDERLCV
jgi:hypothetical protein